MYMEHNMLSPDNSQEVTQELPTPRGQLMALHDAAFPVHKICKIRWESNSRTIKFQEK